MEKPQIEYETVTVKIPKQVMELLRFSQIAFKMTPTEYIEYNILELVRADLDSGEFLPSGKELADKFNINPIFKEILNDEVTS